MSMCVISVSRYFKYNKDNNMLNLLIDVAHWVRCFAGSDFQIDSMGTLLKYHGRSDVVILPDTVKKIGAYAFAQSTVRHVVIPLSVTHIASYAFLDALRLKSLTLPDSICQVDVGAFMNCVNLESCMMSKEVIRLEEKTFFGCRSLSSFIMPNTVTQVGAYAFYGCASLETVYWSQNLKAIENFAFYGCSMLSQAILPVSLTNLGDYAFAKCLFLSEVDMSQCEITVIGNSVFSGCWELAHVSFSAHTKSIGPLAFLDCYGLSDIHFCDNIMDIKIGAFKNTSFMREIELPRDVKHIQYQAFFTTELKYLLCVDQAHKERVLSMRDICYKGVSICTYQEYLQEKYGICAQSELSAREMRFVYRLFRDCSREYIYRKTILDLSIDEVRGLKSLLKRNMSKSITFEDFSRVCVNRDQSFFHLLMERIGKKTAYQKVRRVMHKSCHRTVRFNV